MGAGGGPTWEKPLKDPLGAEEASFPAALGALGRKPVRPDLPVCLGPLLKQCLLLPAKGLLPSWALGGGLHGPPFASSSSPSGLVTGRSRGLPGKTPTSTAGSTRSALRTLHLAAGTERTASVRTNGLVAQHLLDHPARQKGHVWFQRVSAGLDSRQWGGEAQMLRLAEVLSGRQEAREQQDLVAAGVLTPQTPRLASSDSLTTGGAQTQISVTGCLCENLI